MARTWLGFELSVSATAEIRLVCRIGSSQLIKRCLRVPFSIDEAGETSDCAIVGLVLVCCMTAAAQDKGNWRATSSTAKSITGDVALSDEKVAINFVELYDRSNTRSSAGEASALFDADSSAGGKRQSLSAEHTGGEDIFAARTALCGSEDTQWMVTYASGRSLQLAFFSGAEAAGPYSGGACEFNGSVRHVLLREVTCLSPVSWPEVLAFG